MPTIIANGRVILIDDDYKNVSLELISLKDKKKIIYEVDERNGEFSLALKKDEPYIINKVVIIYKTTFMIIAASVISSSDVFSPFLFM